MLNTYSIIVLGVLSWCNLAVCADDVEKLPASLKVKSIAATPASIALSGPHAYRQILLTATLESGETADVTRLVELVGEPKLVSLTPNRLVAVKADGKEELTFRYGGIEIKIPVEVTSATQSSAVSFVKDIQPALSKMGCNAGTCHGAAQGKNGFKLSLRGYDPIYDHRSLTDELSGRRFNRAAPDQSLMLLKASGGAPHVGGVRTRVGEPYYQLVRAWIAEGVKLDLAAPRVTKIEISPQGPIVPLPGMKQQITVTATFADNTTRDVTREAFVESGNIEVISADDKGVVTTLRRGEAPVLVRYEGSYAATTITVMGDRTGFAWIPPPINNYIDELVYKKLQRVKVVPSELCSDDEFVRRVYLDLTGLPPKAEVVTAFLADPRETKIKRDELVDRLVGGPQFVDFWTNKWADLLQVNRKFLGEEGSSALREWIKQSLAKNQPYDQFAYEVLTATGSNIENPAAGYYKVLRDPTAAMENTTHLFMAVRFNCNKCHDHPFERWTQDQYYHLSSYFAQVGRKEDPAFAGQTIGGSAVEGATPLVEVIYDSGAGEVTHERTGQIAAPAFPFAHNDLAPSNAVRRAQLAKWITSKENQFFAKSYVNRVWGYLLGVGLIEPIDDIRAGNPPTNPELLDAMTKDFVNSGFNVQHLYRTICKSRAYQHSFRSNPFNADDEINYSHAIPRRLPAEVLYDAIHVAAGSKPRIAGVPIGVRATELPDAGATDPFLEDFGRPVRESSCECERSTGMVLGPIMKLINGPMISEALTDGHSELTKLVASEPDDAKVIEQVFLRFLARKPSEREVQLAIESIANAGEDLNKLRTELKAAVEALDQKQAVWERGFSSKVDWLPVEILETHSVAGATFKKLEDGSLLAQGNRNKDLYTIKFKSSQANITGIRLEALPDESLPKNGPGRADDGNFLVNSLKASIAPAADAAQVKPVEFTESSGNFSQEGYPVSSLVSAQAQNGWAVAPRFGQPSFAYIACKQPIGDATGSIWTVQLDQQFGTGQHSLGRFRFSVTTSAGPIRYQELPGDLSAIVQKSGDQRTDEEKTKLSTHFRKSDSDYLQLLERIRIAESLTSNKRLVGVQDLAWALINSPAFLFNR